MPTAGVYDIEAVAKRRRQLFNLAERAFEFHDRERYGKSDRHCGICPRPENEPCGDSCTIEREKLNDGITVSYELYGEGRMRVDVIHGPICW